MKKVYPREQKERVLRKLLELGDGGNAQRVLLPSFLMLKEFHSIRSTPGTRH
ncbi:hypothetical protein AXFE_35830 [Acidithrix ferrooxidans]|uniref:Uncharacterized protein n=1 Tax=Acidithrix ferrooxidans TaxID=1280514 RepID=A0A0D8HCB6_9ACTN|nr:hypothetical protein AXFE_35830 [Acidithrix ferrooxidans]